MGVIQGDGWVARTQNGPQNGDHVSDIPLLSGANLKERLIRGVSNFLG